MSRDRVSCSSFALSASVASTVVSRERNLSASALTASACSAAAHRQRMAGVMAPRRERDTNGPRVQVLYAPGRAKSGNAFQPTFRRQPRRSMLPGSAAPGGPILMTAAVPAPARPIVYPDRDGNPMSDNTLQFRWIVTIQGGLDAQYAGDPNVFVAGDLLWYAV